MARPGPAAGEAEQSDKGTAGPGSGAGSEGCQGHGPVLMGQALGWDKEFLIPETSEKVPGTDRPFQRFFMEGVRWEPRTKGQGAKRRAMF